MAPHTRSSGGVATPPLIVGAGPRNVHAPGTWLEGARGSGNGSFWSQVFRAGIRSGGSAMGCGSAKTTITLPSKVTGTTRRAKIRTKWPTKAICLKDFFIDGDGVIWDVNWAARRQCHA